LRPYVIKQGDHLAKLAYKFGFNADTVWKDPKNVQLRQQGHLSQDPNILNPTDMLYIPDSKPPTMHRLTLGTTNIFISSAPTLSVSVRFTSRDGTPRRSVACHVAELADQTGLRTDGQGVVTVTVPVSLESMTVSLGDGGDVYLLRLGHMDPIDTAPGIFKRLQNLGYINPAEDYDEENIDVLRAALCLFRARRSSGGDSAGSAEDPAASPSGAGVSDQDYAGLDPEQSDGDGQPRIVHMNPIAITDDACGPECSGLADNGVLDPSIAALILNAHGG
jgi:hypothetical protein